MAPRIVLHFHPGWSFGAGTVLESIVTTGTYVSQWVTGSSNGGLTARPGGDRQRWENRLFAGRYDGADPHDRPVYGAWNRRDDAYGAAPRFGSGFLVLRPEVTRRATFCWPDSARDPQATGGPELVEELCRLADIAVRDGGDPLDDYVEAQVHGRVDIANDVEAIVLDPSDHAAPARVLDRFEVPVLTHAGYRVRAHQIDPAYRGPVPVRLARELGGDITPARLAGAANSGDHDPQAVKWLWHCLARFGRMLPDRGAG